MQNPTIPIWRSAHPAASQVVEGGADVDQEAVVGQGRHVGHDGGEVVVAEDRGARAVEQVGATAW